MKSLLISLALLCSLCRVHSQGVVNFRNENLSSPPNRLISCLDGPIIGTTMAVQLFYGTDPSSLMPHPTLAYFRASTSAGTWSGANRTLTGIALPPTPQPGTVTLGPQVWMQVVVWDSGANRTVTFDQARVSGGFWGASQIFTYQQRASDPPDALDTAMVNFQGFTILANCVPEPAVALLVLPAIAVVGLLKRRTRRSNLGP